MSVFGRKSRTSQTFHDRKVGISIHDGDLNLGSNAGRHGPMTFDDVSRSLLAALGRVGAEAGASPRDLRDDSGDLLVDHLGSPYREYQLSANSSFLVRVINIPNIGGTSVSVASLELRARPDDDEAAKVVDRIAQEGEAALRGLNTLSDVTNVQGTGQAKQDTFTKAMRSAGWPVA